jgi:hypothetical protein
MNEERIDRLYNLLPAIYRMRDQEKGGALRDLLRVIAEQVNVVEDDIAGLYENWFIETCQDWAVPYIGDLIGYQPIHEAGEPDSGTSARDRARNRILIPRRDVAQTIRNRRRKGTLALLEELARDVAGWPARAVEFSTLLGRTQHLNHLNLMRGRTASLRDNDALAQIDGPFDSTAHTIDVRRINSQRTPGRYNIPSVGLFIWRLKPYAIGRSQGFKPYTISRSPACCVEEVGPHCYSFSVLGHDMQLFVNPAPETDPTHIAEELNLPVAIRRWKFETHKNDYYGPDKSIQIWVPGWDKNDPSGLLPAKAIMPADLSQWRYEPPLNRVAVDPVLGRMVFHLNQRPKNGVRVSCVYAFSDDLGGGEYERPVAQPAQSIIVQVGSNEPVKRIGEAWQCIRKAWDNAPDAPRNGVIEIVDSGAYTEQLSIQLQKNEYLQIRAAKRVRPVLRLLDYLTEGPDALIVTMSERSRITLDGLMIAGRPVAIGANEEACATGPICGAEVNIRHCTLVPGWGLMLDGTPKRGAEASLELYNVRARVRIERSIVGSIRVDQDEVRTDPIPIYIADSIIDATDSASEALSTSDGRNAHTVLTILRSTVFGIVIVHAIELAENAIFTNCLDVARRQLGCMRFCYVPAGCQTPRRHHCQPDLAEQTIEAKLREDPQIIGQAEIDAARKRERFRVRPVFNSVRYGWSDYAQLADLCADEIKKGADDESEMGVFHDLYNPQRQTNVRTRLDEYTPADMQTGIIFET